MITKQQNKAIRQLHRKKIRDQQQQFIIEGPKMLCEAVQHSPQLICEVYGIHPIENLPNHVSFTQISEKELAQVSALKTPQECVAICNYLPQREVESNVLIALDRLQNPGNLGTILRLAAWFGVKKVIASLDTVDCYNSKVVQASMGAIFTIQVEYCSLETALKEIKLPVYGAVMNGENIYQQELPNRGVLLIGNEGGGISKSLMKIVTHPVSIPKIGTGESLNAAMATGILLSEFMRNS